MKVKSKLGFMGIALSMLFAAACTPTSAEVGVLEGHVTIGPLVPAVQVGVPEPTPAPEVYAARQIVVFREGDGRELVRLEIDAQGNFRGELLVGNYVVDINHIGVDSAAGYPRVIEIVAGQATRVEVDIDTGIR